MQVHRGIGAIELVEDRVDLAAVAENCAVLLQDMAADGVTAGRWNTDQHLETCSRRIFPAISACGAQF
jgi:hypothetical protein